MREIPVILFTAAPSIDEKMALLRDPHLGILEKPVSFAQLKTEIERYLV
jgi:DNA-binding NtrC family response regulator